MPRKNLRHLEYFVHTFDIFMGSYCGGCVMIGLDVNRPLLLYIMKLFTLFLYKIFV